MKLSRSEAFVLAKKHAAEVSNSDVSEEDIAISGTDRPTKVVFTSDVAVSFGEKSQDAANLKAKAFNYEDPHSFSIGKPYIKEKPAPDTPYGHGVARSLEVMKQFIENAKKDVAQTFYFSVTAGPCRMFVDLDADECEDVDALEAFAHRLIQALQDFANIKKEDPVRNKYMVTTRHRDGKGSVHILHNGLHFGDPREQAAFMRSFVESKKKFVVDVLKEAADLHAGAAPKNKSAIGVFDCCVYGSPTGRPGRKWNESKRTCVYYNGIQDVSRITCWHADPKTVYPASKKIETKHLSWGAPKRHRNPFEDDVHPSHKKSKTTGSFGAFARYPASFKERYLPVIEKQLGGAACANIKGLKPCEASGRFQFYVEHGSKHKEAMRCCSDPTRFHKSNRKKIFVNFETREIESYDKKTKTRTTKTFPPGVYTECFKGCNNAAPCLVYMHKNEPPTNDGDLHVIEPSMPLARHHNAIAIEVPKHDAFSVEIKGIGTFNNATEHIKRPYSAVPALKIRPGTEIVEAFQVLGCPLETRFYRLT